MHSAAAVFLSFAMLLTSLAARVFYDPRRAVAQTDGTSSLTLPLEGGNDPWYVEHEGAFYYCYSVGNGVAVRTSDAVENLGTGEETVVYRAPEGTNWSGEYWAPELHYLDGAWYIYVAASDGHNETHRMYVLQGNSPTGEFRMLGKLSDDTDRWAIDGTVLTWDGDFYFVWSGWEGETDTGQNLYIAHMRDPAHIDSARACISRPTHRWEKSVQAINEGPTALVVNGRLYIVYSANGSWTDRYCLGMLRFTGGSPLDPSRWAKCPVPVFKAQKTAYSPGHCSFLTLRGQPYIVYHANVESGTGWSGRTVRLQPFGVWGGIPVFGKPLKAGETVILPEKETDKQ